MFRRLLNLGLFFAIPALGAISPILVLPALTASFGSSGWTAIAIGQSVGGAAAVVAELGWSVVGPQAVAMSPSRAARRRMFLDAGATRLMALVLVGPIAALVAAALAPDFKLAAALMAAAISLAALSPSWYLTGLNRPFAILIAESLPRIAAALVSVLLLSNGAPIEIFALAMITAAAWTWFAGCFIAGTRYFPSLTNFRRGPSVVREHTPILLGRIVSVTYTSLPVAIVAGVSVQATASFATVDRLMRMSLTVLAGLPNRLQSWVGHPDPTIRQKRSGHSMLMNLGLGAISGTGFAVLAQWVSGFIFSGTVSISTPLAVVGGAVLACMVTSRGLGLSMVAEGQTKHFPTVNIIAALTGVVAIPALTLSSGAFGAMLGAGLAESAGLLVQLIFIIRHRRKDSGRN